MEDHPAKICDRPRAGLVEGSAVVKRMGGAIVLAEVAVGGDVEDAAGQVVDDAGHGRPVAEVQYRAGVVNDPRVVERAVQPFEVCAGEIGGPPAAQNRPSRTRHDAGGPVQDSRDRHVPAARQGASRKRHTSLRSDYARSSDSESSTAESDRLRPAATAHRHGVDARIGAYRDGVVAAVSDESIVTDARHLIRHPVCSAAPVAVPGVRPDDVCRMGLGRGEKYQGQDRRGLPKSWLHKRVHNISLIDRLWAQHEQFQP